MADWHIPRVVIAATQSGSGKTTIVTGLLAALRGRGLRVQSYKIGPDYIDPGYHALASGHPAHNLDTWLVPEEKALYQAFTSTASAVESLIEGQDYAGAIDALSDLAAPINALFDAVMVMDKDAKIRNNRLALLLLVDRLIRRVADFSKLVL